MRNRSFRDRINGVLRGAGLFALFALCAAGGGFEAYGATTIVNENPTSDEISEAVIAPWSDIVPAWENDATYPWRIEDVDGVKQLRNIEMTEGSVSELKMTFENADRPLIFSMDIATISNYELRFEIYIDEKVQFDRVNPENTVRLSIPSGTHTIRLVVSYYISGYIQLKNIALTYLDSVTDMEWLKSHGLVDPESLPFTITNDSDNPWKSADGLYSTVSEELGSALTFTFSVEKPSIFRFDMELPYSWENTLSIEVDNICYDTFGGGVNDLHYFFDKGEHRMVLYHTTGISSNSSDCIIRNISFYSHDISIDLSKGTLMEQLPDYVENLRQVEQLTLTGTVTDETWAHITRLPNLKTLDLSHTVCEAVPTAPFENQFFGMLKLSPNTKLLGESVLANKKYIKTLEIPDSVTTIGSSAFDRSGLVSVELGPNSQLTRFGYGIFYSTKIKKLHIPDGVRELPDRFAEYCTELSDLKLPRNLVTIGSSAFEDCKSLSFVEFPESLRKINDNAFSGTSLKTVTIPKQLRYLGSRSFSENDSLEYFRSNGLIQNMESYIVGSKNLKTLIIPTPIPPTGNPFSVDKTKVKLVVPDFALSDFKFDEYWCQFVNIVAEDEVSISDYWEVQAPLTLRDGVRMQGKPSLGINLGGELTLKGDTQREFDKTTLWFASRHLGNKDKSAALLNNECTLATTDSINASLHVNGYNWHFITPIADIEMDKIGFHSDKSYSIQRYDGANRAKSVNDDNRNSSSWTRLQSGDILKAGTGYILHTTVDHWLDFETSEGNGQALFGPEERTVNLDAFPSERSADRDWNLIGNPYPCYFDAYYLDVDAPITVWDGSNYRALSLRDDDYVLYPMEAFFIQKPQSGNGNATFLSEGKQIDTEIHRAKNVHSSVDSQRKLFDIEISCGDKCDRTRVVLNPDASESYETSCDAAKFFSLESPMPQIYTISADARHAINERPEDDGTVALGVRTPDSREVYTISAVRAVGTIYLHDAATGVETDLTAAPYTFLPAKSGDDESRFTLRLELGHESSVTELVAGTKVETGEGWIRVTVPEGTPVNVYDARGILVAEGETILRAETGSGIFMVLAGERRIKTIVK